MHFDDCRVDEGRAGQVREGGARADEDDDEQAHQVLQGGAVEEGSKQEPEVQLERGRLAEERDKGQGGAQGDREQAPVEDEVAIEHPSQMIDKGEMTTHTMMSRLKQPSSDSGSGKRRKARGRGALDVIEPGMIQLRINF